MKRYSKETVEQVIDHLGSDIINGLDGGQVASLQQEHGPNKLEEEEKVRGSRLIMERFKVREVLLF